MDSNRFSYLYRLMFNLCLLCLIGVLVSCSKPQPKLKPLAPTAVILAFGDSLTFGTGTTPENSYPAVLAQITGMKIINAGVPGEETTGGLARIEEELDKNNPQLVIVCLGGNDMIRRRPMENIKANLKAIVEIIKKRGIDVIIVAVPKPSVRVAVPSFYEEIGDELKVPVDMESLALLLSENRYKSDYIHLNTLGYQTLAQQLMKFLQTTGALK